MRVGARGRRSGACGRGAERSRGRLVDLRLYAGVVGRHRLVVGGGLVLALALAFLITFRVGSDGVGYRQSEEWSSTSRLGVTQQGFPWGRLFATGASSLTPAAQAKRLGIPVADPNRFKDLAFLYAELATSDPVRRLMVREGPLEGKVAAAPVIGENGITLPLVDVTASSTSAANAKTLAQRAADALVTYVERQQRANDVPASDRVVLEKILRAEKATIVKPRSKSLPILAFLGVIAVTLGLAFALENLRPPVQLVTDQPDENEIPIEPPRSISVR